MGFLAALLPALIPVVSDGLRGAFSRLTGGWGVKPQNVSELITLMQADTERLKALADIDRPSGNISTWVANIRAMQRPIAVVVIVGGYFLALLFGNALHIQAPAVEVLGNYAQMVTFYLFGDRSYMYLKGGK